jgi:hypothetical protein
MILVDVTNRETFERAKYFLDRSEPNGIARQAPPECTFAVVATKADIPIEEWKVSGDETRELAEQHGALYFEVSAMTGAGTQEMKKELLTRMIQNPVTKTAVNSSNCRIL